MAVRVAAVDAVPVTVGRTVLAGGALGIVTVGWLVAVTVPSGFEAVTDTAHGRAHVGGHDA